MKSSALLTIGLLLAALPVAVQAQIHKCNTAEAIVYQDTPCAEGQRESLLAHKKTPARIDQSNASPSVHRPGPGTPLPLGSTARIDQSNASPLVHRTGSGTPLPPAGTPIALGMSDLEVLNLRGWGRPSKITRSKANGVFSEEWVYASPVQGQRKLHFSNANLTAIQTEPAESAESAPQQVIRLTQQ